MQEATTRTAASERRRLLVLWGLTACLFAFVVSYVFGLLDVNDVLRTGLVSDIRSYESIAGSLLDGQLPYRDFVFEHLPLALIPIGILGAIADATGASLWLVWPIAMTPVFILTALWVDRLDPDDPPGFRFIAVSLPLLPLVLFRLEPWIEIFAVAAVVAFVAGHNLRGGVLTMLGALGKGWPVVIAALPWKFGKRREAVTVALMTVTLLGIVAIQDGFRSGRTFNGIHTETVMGSVVLLVRHIGGSALDTASAAGALYVDVAQVLVLLNALPGLALAAIGLYTLVGREESTAVSAVGLIVLGIVLASPLSSTQFIFWIAPFVALLGVTQRRIYVVAGVFALASIAVFEPDTLLWTVEVVLRNGALVGLGIVWARSLLSGPGDVSRVATP